MSHNIYTEKFTTTTSLRNKILKSQDEKIQKIIFAIRKFIELQDFIWAKNQEGKPKHLIEQEEKSIGYANAITIYMEIVLRELLGQKKLTNMTYNITDKTANEIAEKFTEIVRILENV